MKILFLLLLNAYFCHFFKEAKFVSEYMDSDQMVKMIKDRKRPAMVLIYSTGCGHCRFFAPTYIELSESLHELVDFYSLPFNSNYKNHFAITGYPSMFFYDLKSEKFTQHHGNRAKETFAKILFEKYIYGGCDKLDVKDVENSYNNYKRDDDVQNIVYAFFNGQEYVRNFIVLSTKLRDKIDKCCIVTGNYDNKMLGDKIVKENLILSFSKQRGDHEFAEYITDKYNTTTINVVNSNFAKYINDNVKNLYIDINADAKANLIEHFPERNILLFVYDSLDTRSECESFITDIIKSQNEMHLYLFDFILFKKGVNYNKFKNISENNIYLLNKEITLIKKIDILAIKKLFLNDDGLNNDNANANNTLQQNKTISEHFIGAEKIVEEKEEKSQSESDLFDVTKNIIIILFSTFVVCLVFAYTISNPFRKCCKKKPNSAGFEEVTLDGTYEI